ncbi:hypothetical protein BT69DRAFT_775644 [Atractiella rhizophila]|nr:hypothetical protein BT69DRAFT_775644 [Atractiella rhizophila]
MTTAYTNTKETNNWETHDPSQVTLTIASPSPTTPRTQAKKNTSTTPAEQDSIYLSPNHANYRVYASLQPLSPKQGPKFQLSVDANGKGIGARMKARRHARTATLEAQETR